MEETYLLTFAKYVSVYIKKLKLTNSTIVRISRKIQNTEAKDFLM